MYSMGPPPPGATQYQPNNDVSMTSEYWSNFFLRPRFIHSLKKNLPIQFFFFLSSCSDIFYSRQYRALSVVCVLLWFFLSVCDDGACLTGVWPTLISFCLCTIAWYLSDHLYFFFVPCICSMSDRLFSGELFFLFFLCQI